ncbi:MAG: hypothetical protein LBJ00_03410, partial [Planctomycetaceae bacterium]|nr:hypothetical protein [Planctomycetaceae bacterium]
MEFCKLFLTNIVFGIVCCLIVPVAISQTIDVSGVGITVSITPQVQSVAVSSSTDRYWKSFALTGNYTGTPTYDNAELEPLGTEWKMTYTNGGATTEMLQFDNNGAYILADGRVTWGADKTNWVPLSSRTVRCSSTTINSNGYDLAFTMSVRFKYKNKTTNLILYSAAIDAQPVSGKLWGVGIGQIQYSVDNGATYNSMPDRIPFPVSQNVQFKAIKNPNSAPDWPSGFPEYTLPSGVIGIGEIATYSNHTPNKKDSNTGPYTIKFRCGSSTLTKQFYTINVAKLEYLKQTATGTTEYFEYPKRDANYGSGYYLWLPKFNNAVLSSRAINSKEDDLLWPTTPNQKPVWSNAVITTSTVPWKAATSHSTLTAGGTTVVSAECGNTKPVDILVVDIDELTVTDNSDTTNKKIAKPNNQTLYIVQGTDNKATIKTSLKYLAPTAPNGVPACPLLKWSILGSTGTFSTSNNPSELTTSWTESHNREFTIKTWLDVNTETDDTVRKVDVVVAKIETELEKKWNSVWGAVTNKTGTYSTGSTNAGKKWYVLWDCHENRIKPAVLPTDLATKISSVSWNGISTTSGTGLWQNITNTSGTFNDVIPTLTLSNGVTLKGKLKTDIAVTGVQKVEWISNATASTQNLPIVKETGQQETKSFN